MKINSRKVNSRKEAWEMVNKLFPTDYEKDDTSSENAGYSIYASTADNNDSWISDLGDRLEMNAVNESGTIDTMNIWIEEEKEVKGMNATVRSMTGEFGDYKIENIVSIQYIASNLVLTCMEGDTVATRMYNSNTVIVEIH